MRLSIILLLCFSLVSVGFGSAAAAPREFSAGATFEVGYSGGASRLGAVEGKALALVLKAIANAQVSILVAAYSFTSKPIATALLDAHKRGIHVAVIADQKSNGAGARYSVVTFLANQGITVGLNGNYQIFHHKFMVIDDSHVETGSFNYSAAAAERNAENVLIVWNAPELAARYVKEWQRLWDESEILKPRY